MHARARMDGLASAKADGDESLVGSVLANRYRIDAVLGSGGMGRVYAAENLVVQKRVAIKVLHRAMLQHPEIVARFEREALATANLDHPHVASASDYGRTDDGRLYIVLELLDGISLRDELAKGPFSPVRALRIARQIALALAAAHGLGIVHRDLKPENVMLVTRDGERDFVKVLDFGLAKVPVADLAPASGVGVNPITKLGMVYGTPRYMSPEQALGAPVDGRADLYSLGIVLYELLAGAPPFTSNDGVALANCHVSVVPPKLSSRAAVAPGVEAIVERLLAKKAADRFATALEVAAALEAEIARAKAAEAPQGRPKWQIALVAGAVSAVVAGVIWHLAS